MKILFSFVTIDSEKNQPCIVETTSNFNNNIMHRIRKKAISFLNDNPAGYVLASGYFYPTLTTYKFFYLPLTRSLEYKKLACDFT